MEEATDPGHPRNPPDTLTVKSRALLTSPVEGDLPRRQKRRKISTACESCRARKIRCDGDRPICGPCSQRLHGQQSCLYTKDGPKDGVEEQVASFVTHAILSHLLTLGKGM